MLAVNPATAYSLLNDYVTLEPGDWIGLTLANSSVGQYVLALARRAGVRTLAVVRRETAAQRVRALGAERVVLDGESLGDRVAETLGGATLRILLDGGAQDLGELTRSVEDGGTVVAFAAVRGQPPVVPLGDLFRGVSLHAFFILRWIRQTAAGEARADLRRAGRARRAGHAHRCGGGHVPVGAVSGGPRPRGAEPAVRQRPLHPR